MNDENALLNDQEECHNIDNFYFGSINDAESTNNEKEKKEEMTKQEMEKQVEEKKDETKKRKICIKCIIILILIVISILVIIIVVILPKSEENKIPEEQKTQLFITISKMMKIRPKILAL